MTYTKIKIESCSCCLTDDNFSSTLECTYETQQQISEWVSENHGFQILWMDIIQEPFIKQFKLWDGWSLMIIRGKKKRLLKLVSVFELSFWIQNTELFLCLWHVSALKKSIIQEFLLCITWKKNGWCLTSINKYKIKSPIKCVN